MTQVGGEGQPMKEPIGSTLNQKLEGLVIKTRELEDRLTEFCNFLFGSFQEGPKNAIAELKSDGSFLIVQIQMTNSIDLLIKDCHAKMDKLESEFSIPKNKPATGMMREEE